MSDQYDTVSLLDGMKEAGIETNADLTKLYTDYRADRPVVGMWHRIGPCLRFRPTSIPIP